MAQPKTHDTARILFEVLKHGMAQGVVGQGVESGDAESGVAESAGADVGARLDAMSVPVAVAGPLGTQDTVRLLACNTAFADLAGRPAASLRGLPLETLDADPAAGDARAALVAAVAAHGHASAVQSLNRGNAETVRVRRMAVRSDPWPGLDVEGPVMVIFDQEMPAHGVIDGATPLSSGQRIALQMETLLRRYIRQNYRQGLHPAQWSALRYFRMAAPDARSLTSFARAHHTTMGTASTTVSTLVGKGYLEKHGFRGAVNVTEKGEAILRDDPLGYAVASLDQMSEIEREWVQFALTALTDSFDDED